MTGDTASGSHPQDEVWIYPTLDGSNTVFSRPFNATYHSVYGAVSESRHVFIQHGLSYLAQHDPVRILEFGFGTGLNAFLAFLFSIRTGKKIEYSGIEPKPLPARILRQLDYPTYLAAADHTDVWMRMHEVTDFKTDHFTFARYAGWEWYKDGVAFDCIFFDAFAPGAQAELWEAPIFDELFKIISDNGCLVTYCAQGEVRRRLVQAGFKVDRLSGPPGKREMLRALKVQS